MKLSENTFGKLVYFINDELAGKQVDGITYTLKNGASEADKQAIKDYLALRKQIEDEMGVEGADKVFKTYTIRNTEGVATGVVFDLNIDVMSDIMKQLQQMAKERNIGLSDVELNADLIADGPAERRKKEIILMAETAAKRFNEGQKNGEYKYTVALYCRNKQPKISINAVDKNGNQVNVKYDAFALRRDDVIVVNELLTKKFGIRCKGSMVPKEVLPSKTGISYTVVLETIK